MTKWNLPNALSALNDSVLHDLKTSRKTIGHPVAKGDASESAWLKMLSEHLPARYSADRAFVADSRGSFSEQLDVVIFDRQYSPFVVVFNGQKVIPAESVYAVFEAKQEIDVAQLNYARKKVASVRKLHRTSLPIPHAGGTHGAKKPGRILGGLLTFESGWKPPMGAGLLKALESGDKNGRLDLGCVASHGTFWCAKPNAKYKVNEDGMPATAFLLELIARLQELATVPMIDIRAYAKSLKK